MIQEALKFLEEKFVKAAGDKYVHPKEEPGHVYYFDGERTDATPEPRKHIAKDLDSIAEFFSREPASAAAWYSAKAIVCILDDDTRRDIVTMPLAFSPQMKVLMDWDKNPRAVSQADAVFMLRTTFKYCLGAAGDILDVLRKVQFKAGTIQGGDIGKNKSSIGRQIEQEVTGVKEIPEDFYLKVPVFEAPFGQIEATIEVSLSWDAGAGKFTFCPLPGQIEQQIALAEASIGESLREKIGAEERVYYGTP